MRTIKGAKYRASSYLTMRQLLRLFIQKTISVDIIADPEMAQHNVVFENYLRTLKKDGHGFVSHHKEVAKEDLAKIVNSLDPLNPCQLQWLTWLYVHLHLCRRGFENSHDLGKDDLVIEKSGGTELIRLKKNEMTKNHAETDEDVENGGRISAIPGNAKCPVSIIISYMEKLNPTIPAFWQRPKKKVPLGSTVWYDAVPVGHNTLGTMMKTISAFCSLDTVYTNHCLRVSACTLLGEAGYTDLDIQSVSKHKSVSALGIYKRVKTDRKAEMSKSLSVAIGIQPTNSPASSLSTTVASSSAMVPASVPPTVASSATTVLHSPAQVPSTSAMVVSSVSSTIVPPPTFQELEMTDEEWNDICASFGNDDGCCLSNGASSTMQQELPPQIQQLNMAAIKKSDKVVILHNCTGTFNF